MPGQVAIVIAARNEAGNIGKVVRQASAFGDVFVIDNASTDGTGGIAVGADAKVLFHKEDTHIAQSYVDGFRHVLEEDYSHVVQLDAGLSFTPEEIKHLFAFCNVDPDLVLGQRPNNTRKAVSRAGGWLTRLVTGMPFSDPTCGFRCWKADALRSLDLDALTCRAHGFQIELLWQAWKRGFVIGTVPVSYAPGRTSANRAVALEALRAVWGMRRWIGT